MNFRDSQYIPIYSYFLLTKICICIIGCLYPTVVTQWLKWGEVKIQIRVVTKDISIRTKKMNLENYASRALHCAQNIAVLKTDLSRIPEISAHSRLLSSVSESLFFFSVIIAISFLDN